MSRLLPRISVVTPSYNQGRFLERTIQSILDQRYPDLEYLVVDGGSTDNSVEIIRKYAGHLAFWVSEPDRGQSHAINKGLGRATGDLLTWLNSDDYYEPGALRAFADRAMAEPDADVFVGIGQMVDEAGRVTYYKKPPATIDFESVCRWMDGGNFMQPSSMFRRSAWERLGPLDEALHIAFDVDLWLRMAKSNCRFAVMDRLLSTAVAHGAAKTTAFANSMQVDIAVVVIRQGGDAAVRHHLDDMARRLAWCEPNLHKILKNPLVRLVEPAVSRLVKPAARWRDTVPPWAKLERPRRRTE